MHFLDHLMLYTKANEKLKEKDEDRKVKLEIKRAQAKIAADLLVQYSEAVKAMVQARWMKKPPPTQQIGSGLPSTTVPNPMGHQGVGGSKPSAGGRPVVKPIGSADKRSRDVDPNQLGGKKSKVNVPSPGSTAPSGTNVTTSNPCEPMVLDLLRKQPPKFYIKRRIAKDFDGEIYFGSIKKWIPASENDEGVDLWLIEYDDGDAEDLEKFELMEGFQLYQIHYKNDKVGNALAAASAAAAAGAKQTKT